MNKVKEYLNKAALWLQENKVWLFVALAALAFLAIAIGSASAKVECTELSNVYSVMEQRDDHVHWIGTVSGAGRLMIIQDKMNEQFVMFVVNREGSACKVAHGLVDKAV